MTALHTAEEKAFFLEHGYLHAQGVVQGEHLAQLQAAFEEVWAAEKPRVHQMRLLKYKAFIELIEHPPILDRQTAIFGRQTQLLQYDLLRQEPHSTVPERGWHRDFTFPGDYPLSINTILYFDDMTPDRGPTLVVPGTHRGTDTPPGDKRGEPLPGEVPVHAKAGDAVFINSAIWHSGNCNKSDGLRRAAYLYYGYWWLKRYDASETLPWQAFENASEARLRLLGAKMPQGDLHIYDASVRFDG